jgi:hypothetical protein
VLLVGDHPWMNITTGSGEMNRGSILGFSYRLYSESIAHVLVQRIIRTIAFSKKIVPLLAGKFLENLVIAKTTFRGKRNRSLLVVGSAQEQVTAVDGQIN